MDWLNLFLGLLNLGIGLVFLAISLPLRRGSVPRNGLYGFRFRRAFTSEEHWQQINRYGARQMIRWSLLIMVLGIATFFLPLQENVGLIIIVAVIPPLLILIPVIETYRYAQRQ